MTLTATLGTAPLVLQKTSIADRSPLPALPEPCGLLFGEHPQLLGVAPIHLQREAVCSLATAINTPPNSLINTEIDVHTESNKKKFNSQGQI